MNKNAKNRLKTDEVLWTKGRKLGKKTKWLCGKRTSKILINNTKSWNKEIINKWRKVVNTNVNEESEEVAKKKRENRGWRGWWGGERSPRRSSDSWVTWLRGESYSLYCRTLSLQHTGNPLSYSLTQAQPLEKGIVKFTLTDSIIASKSIQWKEKHLTMCAVSNCSQAIFHNDKWQESILVIKQKTLSFTSTTTSTNNKGFSPKPCLKKAKNALCSSV